MTEYMTGPEMYDSSLSHMRDARDTYQPGSPEEVSLLRFAQVQATHANTAMLATIARIIASGMGVQSADLEGWSDVIPATPLKECRGKETRRPECAERHTEDCAYADPPPEPKHVLLDVGTRVLVSDLEWNEETKKPEHTNPQPGRISGHEAGDTKYRWQYETSPGRYLSTDSFAFADNRVQVHPDGPECPPAPRPMKTSTMDAEKVQLLFQRRWVCGVQASGHHNGAECDHRDPHDDWRCGYQWTVPPINDDMASKLGLDGSVPPQKPTGPVLYAVHVPTGKTGRVAGPTDNPGKLLMEWLLPGTPRTPVLVADLAFIPESELERCPNGQTGDECGSGENQCELCLANEDNKAYMIERSMGR